MREKKGRLCLWLFGIHMFISAFTFGGGYVVVPMVRKYFVLRRKLFGEEELMEMAAVSQSVPGAIAVNLAAVTGYRTAGILGALTSAAASVLPPFLIMTVIARSYEAFIANQAMAAVLKGMQAGAAVLIAETAADMCRMAGKERSLLFDLMIPGIFAACFIGKWNAALVLALCAGLCMVRAWLRRERPEETAGEVAAEAARAEKAGTEEGEKQ